ncbi:hypothetical protein BDZ97DRAFT_1764135 [Flammula alnicola]|nr:hypothetical protein BDZ97DRAFT_1764135 [Flammula alnicola]
MPAHVTLEEATKLVAKWEKRLLRLYNDNEEEEYLEEHELLFKGMLEAHAAISRYDTPLGFIDYMKPAYDNKKGADGIVPFRVVRKTAEEAKEREVRKPEQGKEIAEGERGSEGKRKRVVEPGGRPSASEEPRMKEKGKAKAVEAGIAAKGGEVRPMVDGPKIGVPKGKSKSKKEAETVGEGSGGVREHAAPSGMRTGSGERVQRDREDVEKKGEGPQKRKEVKVDDKREGKPRKKMEVTIRVKPKAPVSKGEDRHAAGTRGRPKRQIKSRKTVDDSDAETDSEEEEKARPKGKKGKARVELTESEDGGEDEDEDEYEEDEDKKVRPLAVVQKRKTDKQESKKPPKGAVEVDTKCVSCAKHNVACIFVSPAAAASAAKHGKTACWTCKTRKVRCEMSTVSRTPSFGLDTPLGSLGDVLVPTPAAGSSQVPAPGLAGEEPTNPTTVGELLVDLLLTVREVKEQNRELRRDIAAVDTHLGTLSLHRLQDRNDILEYLKPGLRSPPPFLDSPPRPTPPEHPSGESDRSSVAAEDPPNPSEAAPPVVAKPAHAAKSVTIPLSSPNPAGPTHFAIPHSSPNTLASPPIVIAASSCNAPFAPSVAEPCTEAERPRDRQCRPVEVTLPVGPAPAPPTPTEPEPPLPTEERTSKGGPAEASSVSQAGSEDGDGEEEEDTPKIPSAVGTRTRNKTKQKAKTATPSEGSTSEESSEEEHTPGAAGTKRKTRGADEDADGETPGAPKKKKKKATGAAKVKGGNGRRAK